MADDRRIRYLTELDASLPMPLERRAEVIEEIDAHLDDAAAAHLERGGAPDEAEDRAQAGLGPPHALAADLARSEQSTWRLLAGVGAGVRTGIGQWIYGFLLGWLLLLLGIYGVVAIVQLSDRLFQTGWTFQFIDQGWNTLILTGAIAFGLFHAGRAVPRAVAIASRRPVPEVRSWVASFGTAAAPVLLVFIIELPQNWASAMGLALASLAFAIGIYRPSIVSSRLRPSYLLLIGALVILPALGMVVMTQSSGGAPQVVDGPPPDRGLAMVGPLWADPLAVDEPVLWSVSLGNPSGTGRAYEWELNGEARLAGLSDLRVEAWHSDLMVDGRLDPRFDRPFAVAPIARDGQRCPPSSTPRARPAWPLGSSS